MNANTPQDPKGPQDPQQEREPKDAKRTGAEEKKIREAAHDHTVADSMIASDPPSSIPDPADEDAVEEMARPPVKQDEKKK